jgi:hypothetical protein
LGEGREDVRRTWSLSKKKEKEERRRSEGDQGREKRRKKAVEVFPEPAESASCG